MERNVTVVIPSYNRAHLLEKTVPTYYQERVKEIIIVDDCSPDNTSEVVLEMQKKYPYITYIRQPKNLKQTAAKNRGLDEVKTEWVYFGDDDSILAPGTIDFLYETCIYSGSDICGATVYYMNEGEDSLSVNSFIEQNKKITSDIRYIVDLERFHANFSVSYGSPIEVPFCHACALSKSDLAKLVRFDENYKGNAYREETDFFVRCNKAGAKIMYDSRAAQINLPPSMSSGGGARGKSKWKYRYWMVRNNWYFLSKNFAFLKEKYGLKTNKYALQLRFISGFVVRPLKRLFHIG